MTKYFLPAALSLAIFSCGTADKPNSNVDTTAVATETPIVQENESSEENTTSLSYLVNLADREGVYVPINFNSFFGVDEGKEMITLMGAENVGPDAYALAMHYNIACDPLTCQHMIIMGVIGGETLISRYSFLMNREEGITFGFFQQKFFLAETEHWEYEEDGESDVQKRTSAPPTVEQVLFVLLNDQITPLAELDKHDLSYSRNLIFARYGYKFKTDSVRAYFANASWYEPRYDNVDDQLSASDKKIIKLLAAEEARRK